MAGPKTQVKVSGTWKTVNKMWIKVGGVWKKILRAYVKVSGSWRLIQVFDDGGGGGGGSHTVIYDTFSSEVNPFVDAGSPAGDITLTVIVNTGIEITASTTSAFAMVFTGISSGANVILINNGFILAKGGDGGAGGNVDSEMSTATNGAAGSNGGMAIEALTDMSISGSGLISGGYRGGNGGNGFFGSSASHGAGGGGGGGAPYGSGGNGGQVLSGNPNNFGDPGSAAGNRVAGAGGLGRGGAANGNPGGDNFSGNTPQPAIDSSGFQITVAAEQTIFGSIS